jgi:hypothetical protein
VEMGFGRVSFDMAPLACVLKMTPVDYVTFSIDYPFPDLKTGKDFLGEVEREGLITGEDLKNFV